MIATDRPLSLRKLATVLGVSQPFLSQIWSGKRPLPDSLRVKIQALGASQMLISDKQALRRSEMVPRTGIEPATHGFSVHCSTD